MIYILFNKLILLIINIFYVIRHSKVTNEMHMSTEMQKITEVNSVILEDTPNQNPFVTQNQLTVIKSTSDGTKSETGENIFVQNTKYTPVKKRRLLPLTQISQYSISPIEERKCTPEKSTSTKLSKRIKKKPRKRKSICSKNVNNIKPDIPSKQVQSDSDCDIFEDKKKTRKPKKVISKKIFIKKFADEKVLNILERNRQNKANNSVESRDSLNDFVKCRITSIQWNKYQSQKIIIVTTGLSKE